MMNVLPIAAFSDNYIWLIGGNPAEKVAIVDPGEAKPVLQTLERKKLKPVAILCTHHHWDHVDGINDIRARYDIPVYGPASERIAGLTHPVQEGDRVELPELQKTFDVLGVPGHTRNDVAYYAHGMLFCGDTLFSAGCGRLLGGTAEQMYRSLSRLADLPGDTRIYCAHEYTINNLRFALTVEPDNTDARTYLEEAEALRARNQPTLPSTLDREQRVNPFLRVSEVRVHEAACRYAGELLASETEVFATLRRWKDNF